MSRVLNSFKIHFGNRVLDYRLGRKLNLEDIKSFFQSQFLVEKLWYDTRHILGILNKNNTRYCLKLSTTEGMSFLTRNEYHWNNYFHQYFPLSLPFTVPKNYDSGIYKDRYFYLITDYFTGKLLCQVKYTSQEVGRLAEYIPSVILFSEAIQKLPKARFTDIEDEAVDYQKIFIVKVNKWFSDIPINIKRKYKVAQTLALVEEGIDKLSSKPRHGDFTPWHIIKLSDSRLGLIDGEHALADGVEGYDICYFIQRVFSVLKNPLIARDTYARLLIRGYQVNKLKVVLASRAIGGFWMNH